MIQITVRLYYISPAYLKKNNEYGWCPSTLNMGRCRQLTHSNHLPLLPRVDMESCRSGLGRGAICSVYQLTQGDVGVVVNQAGELHL